MWAGIVSSGVSADTGEQTSSAYFSFSGTEPETLGATFFLRGWMGNGHSWGWDNVFYMGAGQGNWRCGTQLPSEAHTNPLPLTHLLQTNFSLSPSASSC